MQRIWYPDKRSLLALAVLTFLWFFFLRNSLDGTTSFALYMDNEFFLGPVLSAMSDSLRAGEWPLRFDTALGGLPLYDFTQLTPYYPLYLLPLPLYDTPQDTIHGIHMVVVLHLLIMLFNTYIFLRVLGASRVAAVAGAALTAFGANNYAYAYWVNIVAPYAWFPLFLAGLIGLAQGRPRRTYAAMTWVGIVMLTLASPAQPLIHALMTAAVFSVFFWFSRAERGYAAFKAHLIPVAGLACICLLVLAPVLIPPVVNLDGMMRSIGPFPPVYGNDRIPFAAFEAEQLALTGLGGVLFKSIGPAVGQQFVGLIVFALALLKVFSRQRNWMVNALAFIAAYSLVSAFGTNLGLGYVNYWIPLVNKIREPSRFLFLFQFATCVLAALALDDLRQLAEDAGKRLLKRQWLAIAFLIGAALLIRLLLPGQIIAVIPPLVSALMLLVLLAFTWFAPRLRVAGKGFMLAGAWSVAALGTLTVEVTWQAPHVVYSQYETSNMAGLDAALQRIVELDPSHDYRVIFEGSIDKAIAAMLGSYRGIRTLNMYFNPLPRRQLEELVHYGVRADNYAQVLGAKYLLCKDCPAEAVQGYSYSESVAGYDLYTTTDVLPHSYVATGISGDFSHLNEFVERAAPLPLDANFLFVETAQRPRLQDLDNASLGNCASREQHRGTSRVSIGVECERPGLLVLNKFNDWNWRVWVDGNQTDVLNVNGNQLGVAVPPGTHVVEFVYRPIVVRVTRVLAVLGLLLSLGMAFRKST